MAKTMKVLDINYGAINYCCIKQLDTTSNPYRLYSREWRDGAWHKRLIVKYPSFQSVIWYIHNESVRGDWR